MANQFAIRGAKEFQRGLKALAKKAPTVRLRRQLTTPNSP